MIEITESGMLRFVPNGPTCEVETVPMTFPKNAGCMTRKLIAVSIAERLAKHLRNYAATLPSLSPVEPATTTEKEPRDMTENQKALKAEAANLRKEAAEYEREANKKPVQPRLNLSEFQVKATANGFILRLPRLDWMMPGTATCSGPEPYTFETFESLVKFLRGNIARPDKPAKQ